MHLAQLMDALHDNRLIDSNGDGQQDLDAAGEKVKFDFINFDACLMNSAEIDILVSDYADYYIASPETEPGYGQYYEDWLSMLGKDPAMDTYELGKKIVDDFIAFYDKPEGDGADQEGTLAVINTKKLMDSGFTEALTEVNQILTSQAEIQDADGEFPFYDELSSAKNVIQYGEEDYFDLGNLMSQLPIVQHEFAGKSQLKNSYEDAAISILKALSDPEVIYARGTEGIVKDENIYMDADGELKTGKFKTSGIYIFFPVPDLAGGSELYSEEVTAAAGRLPEGDPRRDLLENYCWTMVDYDLISKSGQDVGTMIYSGTDKNEMGYDAVREYWKRDLAMTNAWNDFIQPLIERRGGEEACKGWLSAVIGQQVNDAVSKDNVTATKVNNENGKGYHFLLSNMNKRAIDRFGMDLIAELPAAEKAVKANSFMESVLADYPELGEFHIGSFEGEEYIDPNKINTTSAETMQESLNRWMRKPYSEWDISEWDGKWYAIKDTKGDLHAAEINRDENKVLVRYGKSKDIIDPTLATLIFGEDNKLSEIALKEDTGFTSIDPAALKESYDFMPVQTIDLSFFKIYLPMSGSAIHVSADNFQSVELDYTDVSEIKDIADTNGDGIAVDRRATVTDIYGSKLDLTDFIKDANGLQAKGNTVRVRASKLKKKAQTIACKEAISISGADGTVTYKLAGVKKARFKKSFKVNAKSGRISVKKGMKKGTYKLTIEVRASGSIDIRPAVENVTVKVQVR